jgi:hypothetical protein
MVANVTNQYPRRTLDETRTRLKTRAVAIIALLIAASACNPFTDSEAGGPMTLAPVGSGSVFVSRAGRDIEVTGRFSLERGDVVRTRSMPGRVQLEGDRSAAVAPNTNLRIVDGASVDLLEGSVLAEGGSSINVAFDDVVATTGGGVVRVSRDQASATAATYRGITKLDAPGQETIRLRPLFEASVAAGDILDPRPYRVDSDDLWDRSRLTAVVELDEQLARYASAISGPLDGVGASYFSSIGGPRAGTYMARYLRAPGYAASDLLIGYSIAELVDEENLGASLGRAFRLSRAGGQWGVIATIMRVPAGSLVASLEDAILAAGAVASRSGDAGGPAVPGPAGSDSEPETSSGDDQVTRGEATGGPDGGNGAGAPDGSDGGANDDPEGGGEEPPPEECANVVDCLIDGLLPGLP